MVFLYIFPHLWKDTDKYTIITSSYWLYLNEFYEPIDTPYSEEEYKRVYDMDLLGKHINARDYYLHEIYYYDKQNSKTYNVVDTFKQNLIDEDLMINLLNQIDDEYNIKSYLK